MNLMPARFGISLSELNNQQLGPMKYSYTRHELSVAQNGNLLDLLVTMTPCLWGYGELARNMVREYGACEQSPYADWINYYLTKEYYQLGKDNWWLIDNLAKDFSNYDISRLESNYIKSFYFEVKSWDSYYLMEEWTILNHNSVNLIRRKHGHTCRKGSDYHRGCTGNRACLCHRLCKGRGQSCYRRYPGWRQK